MTGNVWFIVGASSGFGRAIAIEALKRGDNVAAASRDASKMTDLKDDGAMTLKFDVTSDETAIMDMMQKVVDVYGRITHCVNAAGYLLEGVIEAASYEETRCIFATNVLGTATVTRCALRFLRPQGFGVIANFGSLASWEGGLAYGYYSATKLAVSGFTESLNLECRPLGVAAVVIEPGFFRTKVLNEGGSHRLLTQEQLQSEYADAGLAVQKEAILHMDNRQPGNVDRGASVIVDVLTQTGVGSGREIPPRLVLGSDALRGIRNKLKNTEMLLREWEDVIVSTDYDCVEREV
ncbi:estradiol 17-beta-dehydrogenase [Xylaria bambusicola]|uniref:estradiol 17-beta-dehydrogenase n=1 Tax=Xylaria bambusicola TaxID=326684 RepID=UPI002007AB97|nr:estradiol 17-beta-dehydrogenase [Xylaria bambusicola]KAI0525666.1 estradiol 17-beta-dehydrogenase [Xylaria bambusicola]